MNWDLEEAIGYYKAQGAPRDQNALVSFLREVQDHHGGSIPAWILPSAAEGFGVKESLLRALIRRYPRLRLENTHLLELCSGRNCGKHTSLLAAAEKLREKGVTVRTVPCMRMCAKGPNLKWDGTLYNGADLQLLKKLTEE